MAKTKRPLTEIEREQRRAQQRELVAESVEQLRTSDGWQGYLKARRTFHDHSRRNVLLILHQRPSAIRVAGFRAWLDLGYCVKKRPADVPEGQWAIRIWARCEPTRQRLQALRDAGANPDDRPRPIYKLVSVFAQDQVAELPPPAAPAPLEPPAAAPIAGDSHVNLLAGLAGLAREIGYTFEIASTRQADGRCDRKSRRILLDASLSPNGQLLTGIHKLAHALIGDDELAPELTRAEEELVVESVIFSSCQAPSRCWAGSSVGDRCHRGALSAEEVSGTGESHEWCLGLRDLADSAESYAVAALDGSLCATSPITS